MKWQPFAALKSSFDSNQSPVHSITTIESAAATTAAEASGASAATGAPASAYAKLMKS